MGYFSKHLIGVELFYCNSFSSPRHPHNACAPSELKPLMPKSRIIELHLELCLFWQHPLACGCSSYVTVLKTWPSRRKPDFCTVLNPYIALYSTTQTVRTVWCLRSPLFAVLRSASLQSPSMSLRLNMHIMMLNERFCCKVYLLTTKNLFAWGY